MPDRRDQVFISYALEDVETVRKLYASLDARGVHLWFDEEEQRIGPWKKRILKAIAQSRYFIICISENALRKTGDKPGFQDEELDYAHSIAQQQSVQDFTIIPLRLEDCDRGDHRLSVYQQFDLFEDWDGTLDALAVQVGGEALATTGVVDKRTEFEKYIEGILGKAATLFFAGASKQAHQLVDTISDTGPVRPPSFELDRAEINIPSLVAPQPGHYSVVLLEDVSHALAKRYSANLLIDRTTPKEGIIRVVQEATNEIKKRKYYRNKQVRSRFRNKSADVVWLFVYLSAEDVPHANWICRSLWISENLPDSAAPSKLKGEHIGGRIILDWSSRYESTAEFIRINTVTKEELRNAINGIMGQVEPLIQTAIDDTDSYETRHLPRQAYLKRMQEFEQSISELHWQAQNIGLAPPECHDLSVTFQSLMASAHDISLPFSERGLKKWKEEGRSSIVRSAMKDYGRDLKRFNDELAKQR